MRIRLAIQNGKLVFFYAEDRIDFPDVYMHKVSLSRQLDKRVTEQIANPKYHSNKQQAMSLSNLSQLISLFLFCIAKFKETNLFLILKHPVFLRKNRRIILMKSLIHQ